MHQVVVELVRSADWARAVVLVNGHGGNVAAVERAVAQLEAEGRRVLAWWPRVAGGDPHAGHTETSLMLAVRPDLVRLERAEPGPIPSTADLVRSGVWALSAERRAGRSTGRVGRARRRVARSARRRSRPRGRRVAGVTRYRFDRTVERHGDVVIGGSPLKLFRLTTGGVAVVDRIERGEAVEPSILVDRLLDAGAIHPVHDARRAASLHRLRRDDRRPGPRRARPRPRRRDRRRRRVAVARRRRDDPVGHQRRPGGRPNGRPRAR